MASSFLYEMVLVKSRACRHGFYITDSGAVAAAVRLCGSILADIPEKIRMIFISSENFPLVPDVIFIDLFSRVTTMIAD